MLKLGQSMLLMEHRQWGRQHSKMMIGGSRESLVGLHVLLEVILSAEGLPTARQGAGEGLHPGVDSLVARELLVPRERFSALRKGTLIRPLA